jgi:hypothetical protein
MSMALVQAVALLVMILVIRNDAGVNQKEEEESVVKLPASVFVILMVTVMVIVVATTIMTRKQEQLAVMILFWLKEAAGCYHPAGLGPRLPVPVLVQVLAAVMINVATPRPAPPVLVISAGHVLDRSLRP